MRYAFRLLSGVSALILISTFAYADASYALTGTLVGSTGATETWRITLSIDTSGYTGGGVAIGTVAIKVSSHVVGSELYSTPVGLWNLVPGGLGGGCDSFGRGFACIDSGGIGVMFSPGDLLSWTFDQTIQAGSLFNDGLAASIKVQYVDASGRKVGSLVSKNKSVGVPERVPEPGYILLLGIGFLAVCMGTIVLKRHSRTK